MSTIIVNTYIDLTCYFLYPIRKSVLHGVKEFMSAWLFQIHWNIVSTTKFLKLYSPISANNSILCGVQYIFIRPSLDGSDYGMALSVRPSVRPSGHSSVRPVGCQTCGTHISVTGWWISSIRSSVELSRPVVGHCHGNLPICPIWACPWAKNLSNLPQIGSRLCGSHISETAGWMYPI